MFRTVIAEQAAAQADAAPSETSVPTETSMPTRLLSAVRVETNWSHFTEKVVQGAFLILSTKLLASWAIATLTEVAIRNKMAWGFIPYAGLETTTVKFRTLAAWSTTIVSIAAAVWVAVHYVRRRHLSTGQTWAAALALPMAATLALLEWSRSLDGVTLIPGRYLMWNLLIVGIPLVLFLGFIEAPLARKVAADHNQSLDPPQALDPPHDIPVSLAEFVSNAARP